MKKKLYFAKDASEYRTRQYKVLLYADNKQHMRTLRYIRRCMWDCFIAGWHYEYNEDGHQIEQGRGKRHCHVLFDFPNSRRWSALVDELRVEYRFVWPMRYRIGVDKQGKEVFNICDDDLRKGFLYLVHRNKPDMTQYDSSALFGSWRLCVAARQVITEYEAKQVTMRLALQRFRGWLMKQSKIVSFTYAFECLQYTDYYKALSSPIARQMIMEHNAKFCTPSWRVSGGEDDILDLSDGLPPF